MPKRKPKTLLEWNVLLAAGALMTEEQRAAGKRLPVMTQARLMVKAMPRATRVAEFIAMWAIAKYQLGEVTVDGLADYWSEPVRTMYKHLDEFREVWAPAKYDSPDALADGLIADYRRRKERLTGSQVARLLGAPVSAPSVSIPGVSL